MGETSTDILNTVKPEASVEGMGCRELLKDNKRGNGEYVDMDVNHLNL